MWLYATVKGHIKNNNVDTTSIEHIDKISEQQYNKNTNGSSSNISPSTSSTTTSPQLSTSQASSNVTCMKEPMINAFDESKLLLSNIPITHSMASIECICQGFGQLLSCKLKEKPIKSNEHIIEYCDYIVEYCCVSECRYAESSLKKTAVKIWGEDTKQSSSTNNDTTNNAKIA